MKINENTIIESGNTAELSPINENTNQSGELLAGIIPPLVTPLAGRDQLDIPGLERLIEHTLAGGVHGLFILGTSGEGPSLSYRLRRELISIACRLVGRRVPVLVGITDTCLVEAIALANHSAEAGVRAVVASTPYYFPTGQSELIQHTRQLVSELSLPLFLYNMPQMTKIWFEPDTVRQLLELDGIVGLKDSSGDLDYFQQLIKIAKARPDWRLFVGPEISLVNTLYMGGHGGVNGGAQIDPQLLVGLYNAACAGDLDRIAGLQQRLLRLGRIYTFGQHPSAGLKCALSLMGICRDELAPPLASLAAPEREKVRAVLEELNLLPVGMDR